VRRPPQTETPRGRPRAARPAGRPARDAPGRHPDPTGFDLRPETARRYAVPQDWITLGNGSNDILEIAAHALLQPGESAVYAQYSFVVYALATQAVGARAMVVPARDFGHDLDAMRAAVEPTSRAVF